MATIHLSRLNNLAGGGVLRPISTEELQRAGLGKVAMAFVAIVACFSLLQIGVMQ